MIGKLFSATVLSLAVASVSSTASAEESAFKASILAFGDAYYLASDNDSLDGENGFRFRRVYLTGDWKIDNVWSARARLEAASAGDFVSSDTMEPDVKDMYLQGKFGDHKAYFGMSGTPTWGTVEKFWGYRDMAKTALDRQKYGSSRDTGVAMKGKLGGGFAYHVMVGNGSGTKTENEKDKTGYGAVSYTNGPWTAELYGDWNTNGDSTQRLFAGYKNGDARLGAEYAIRDRDDDDIDLYSVFAVYGFAPKMEAILRYDHADANPSAKKISYLPYGSESESDLFMAGVSYQVNKAIRVIPNVEYLSQDEGDQVIAKMTLSVKF